MIVTVGRPGLAPVETLFGRRKRQDTTRTLTRLDSLVKAAELGGLKTVESPELAADASSESPSELAVVAMNVYEMLVNPEMVGQAIVLNEVLHRPEERWVCRGFRGDSKLFGPLNDDDANVVGKPAP